VDAWLARVRASPVTPKHVLQATAATSRRCARASSGAGVPRMGRIPADAGRAWAKGGPRHKADAVKAPRPTRRRLAVVRGKTTSREFAIDCKVDLPTPATKAWGGKARKDVACRLVRDVPRRRACVHARGEVSVGRARERKAQSTSGSSRIICFVHASSSLLYLLPWCRVEPGVQNFLMASLLLRKSDFQVIEE